MKNSRKNKNIITRCLNRYVEDGKCSLISKHFEYDSGSNDILVHCLIGLSKYGDSRTFPIVLSGRSLCHRYGEAYDE